MVTERCGNPMTAARSTEMWWRLSASPSSLWSVSGGAKRYS
ncbi:uncharacterized protein G2W53_018841 [Senna tora]|uniref:Uncharacterized protein n=1 Tax=Senna tora TaxID=362788 RepID=A0A834WLN6_9FABA|nr:uncharacterized protein G2W53_018841 [Senna tora]